jgi:hypothetical protein
VTNEISLGCPLFLPVHTVNCVQTLKAKSNTLSMPIGQYFSTMLDKGGSVGEEPYAFGRVSQALYDQLGLHFGNLPHHIQGAIGCVHSNHEQCLQDVWCSSLSSSLPSLAAIKSITSKMCGALPSLANKCPQQPYHQLSVNASGIHSAYLQLQLPLLLQFTMLLGVEPACMGSNSMHGI